MPSPDPKYLKKIVFLYDAPSPICAKVDYSMSLFKSSVCKTPFTLYI